jgi:thioredoxin 1
MLSSLADKSDGKVKLGLLDIEANPVLTEQLHVSSIPKVVVYKGGEKITELLGVRPESDYQDVINGL